MTDFLGPSGEVPKEKKKCQEGYHLENGKCVKDEEGGVSRRGVSEKDIFTPSRVHEAKKAEAAAGVRPKGAGEKASRYGERVAPQMAQQELISGQEQEKEMMNVRKKESIAAKKPYVVTFPNGHTEEMTEAEYETYNTGVGAMTPGVQAAIAERERVYRVQKGEELSTQEQAEMEGVLSQITQASQAAPEGVDPEKFQRYQDLMSAYSPVTTSNFGPNEEKELKALAQELNLSGPTPQMVLGYGPVMGIGGAGAMGAAAGGFGKLGSITKLAGIGSISAIIGKISYTQRQSISEDKKVYSEATSKISAIPQLLSEGLITPDQAIIAYRGHWEAVHGTRVSLKEKSSNFVTNFLGAPGDELIEVESYISDKDYIDGMLAKAIEDYYMERAKERAML